MGIVGSGRRIIITVLCQVGRQEGGYRCKTKAPFFLNMFICNFLGASYCQKEELQTDPHDLYFGEDQPCMSGLIFLQVQKIR